MHFLNSPHGEYYISLKYIQLKHGWDMYPMSGWERLPFQSGDWIIVSGPITQHFNTEYPVVLCEHLHAETLIIYVLGKTRKQHITCTLSYHLNVLIPDNL